MTIACNPKEYYESFENRYVNKKHKGIKTGSTRMNFENFADRLVSVTNFDTFEKPPANYKEVSWLTIFQDEMQKN